MSKNKETREAPGSPIYATKLWLGGEETRQELLGMKWSSKDKKLFHPVEGYWIACFGSRKWGEQRINGEPMIIPGNSVVWLTRAGGSMDFGWSRGACDPRGYFLDNGEPVGCSPNNRTRDDVNKCCMLVGIKSGPQSGRRPLINHEIEPCGASVGDEDTIFILTANEGGTVWTAFNDSDSNNSGRFIQHIRWMEASLYAQMMENVMCK